MSHAPYLDHVRALNRHDLSGFRRFLVGERQVGWVKHDFAEKLRGLGGPFAVNDSEVVLPVSLPTPDERGGAMAESLAVLAAQGLVDRPRGETYPVVGEWGETPLLELDREHVPWFGLKAFGVHLNGYVRRPDGLHLWLGRRAPDKRVEPNKLDNLVGGGQQAGLTLRQNLIKECWEEASIDRAMAERAIAVGCVRYCVETATGLKPDTLFCYDLELPESFAPHSQEGEHSGFMLLPVRDILAMMRDVAQFKPNVVLVILDFALRHGVLDPDETGLYGVLATELRRPLP